MCDAGVTGDEHGDLREDRGEKIGTVASDKTRRLHLAQHIRRRPRVGRRSEQHGDHAPLRRVPAELDDALERPHLGGPVRGAEMDADPGPVPAGSTLAQETAHPPPRVGLGLRRGQLRLAGRRVGPEVRASRRYSST